MRCVLYVLSCGRHGFGRNKHIFENEALDAPMMATGFVRLVDEYGMYANRVFRGQGGLPSSSASWCKPPNGVLKANFDAYLSSNGEVGLGAIFQDSLGQVVAMGVKRVEAK